MPYPHAAWPAPEVVARLIADAQRGPARRVDAFLATLRPPLVAFFAAHLAPDAAEDLA
jgi:hypothetical protein